MASLTLFVTMPFEADRFASACAMFSEAAPLIRAEEGCSIYEVRKEASGAPDIHVFETWTDDAAFKKHTEGRLSQSLFAKCGEWCRADIKVNRMVGLD